MAGAGVGDIIHLHGIIQVFGTHIGHIMVGIIHGTTHGIGDILVMDTIIVIILHIIIQLIAILGDTPVPGHIAHIVRRQLHVRDAMQTLLVQDTLPDEVIQ